MTLKTMTLNCKMRRRNRWKNLSSISYAENWRELNKKKNSSKNCTIKRSNMHKEFLTKRTRRSKWLRKWLRFSRSNRFNNLMALLSGKTMTRNMKLSINRFTERIKIPWPYLSAEFVHVILLAALLVVLIVETSSASHVQKRTLSVTDAPIVKGSSSGSIFIC